VGRIAANGCIRDVLRCDFDFDGMPHTRRANMIAVRGCRSEGKEPDGQDLERPGGLVEPRQIPGMKQPTRAAK
jgi:hypothetical protein